MALPAVLIVPIVIGAAGYAGSLIERTGKATFVDKIILFGILVLLSITAFLVLLVLTTSLWRIVKSNLPI